MIFPYNQHRESRISANQKLEYENLRRSINSISLRWHELNHALNDKLLKLQKLDSSFPQWSIESNDIFYLFASLGIFKLPIIYLLDYFLCQQSIEFLVANYPKTIIHLICILIPLLILLMDVFIGARIYLAERLRKELHPNHYYRFWWIIGIIFSFVIPTLVLSSFYAFGRLGSQEFAISIPLILLSLIGHFLMIYDNNHLESMYFYQYKLYRMITKRSIKKDERMGHKLQRDLLDQYPRFEKLHNELQEDKDISAEFYLITSARSLIYKFVKSDEEQSTKILA